MTRVDTGKSGQCAPRCACRKRDEMDTEGRGLTREWRRDNERLDQSTRQCKDTGEMESGLEGSTATDLMQKEGDDKCC